MPFPKLLIACLFAVFPPVRFFHRNLQGINQPRACYFTCEFGPNRH